MKRIKDYSAEVTKIPEIKEYRKRMKKAGRCIQCINPWYDGMCSCDGWKDNKEERNKIARMAIRFLSSKQKEDDEKED